MTKHIDPYLQKVIDDQIIEKYITKYYNRRSPYLKQEMRSHIIMLLLENQDKYLKADRPLNYMQGLIIHQLNSNNSTIYRLYIRYYRNHETFVPTESNDTIE